MNGVEDRRERARAFGIEDAIETLRVGERPLLALRALAHGDARPLEAAARSDDEAALLIEVAGKGVQKRNERIGFAVVAAARRIPTVVADAAEREEVAGDAHDVVGLDAGDLGGFFGRVAVHFRHEEVPGGREANRGARERRHVARPVEREFGRGIFGKARGLAVLHFNAAPDDGGRLLVEGRVAVLGAALDHVGFGEGLAVRLDEVGSVRVTREEVEVDEVFAHGDVEEPLHEGRVGARTDREPFGVAEGRFRHARVDEDDAAALLAGFGEGPLHAHGAVEGAADQKEIAAVGVVGFDLARAVEALAEHEAAAHDGGAVAGRRVRNDVRGAERKAEPVLEGAEVVRGHRDGVFAVLLDDFLHALGDVVQGFVPGNLHELSFAALARALHGLLEANRGIPHVHRARAAGAVAALRMRGVRVDADGVKGRLRAVLVHGEHAAVAAAHVAGDGMGRPAFVLQTGDFGFDVGPRGHRRGGGARRGRRTEEGASTQTRRSGLLMFRHEWVS